MFRQDVDLRSDRYKTAVTTGSLQSSDGLDEGAWTSSNGIVTPVDLPSLAQDARARSFLLREGWRETTVKGKRASTGACDIAAADCIAIRTPAGSTAVLWFDRRTHLPIKTVLDVDDGQETTTYTDWRRVGRTLVAFGRSISDETGASVSYKASGIKFETAIMTPARPVTQPHGRLDGALPSRVPFVLTGIDRGHIVIPAMVDGRSVRLIFDSGGANYFTPSSARELGLSVAGGVNIGGVGETSETGGVANVRSITVGGATLSDEAALVGPLPYPAVRPRAGLAVAGLTGYEFLSEFRTTIDYAAREIAFDRFGGAAPAGTTIPFFSDGHSVYIEATVDGASGLFRLDTGDGGALTVFRSFADRHRLFAGGGRTVRLAGGVGGTIGAREVSARGLTIAGNRVVNVPVSISDTSAGAFHSRTLAGNLGSAVLSRFTLTFDYRAHQITFAPNDRVGQPFDSDHTGLSLNQNAPDALDVLSVAKASPAATAGVRGGDRIVAIDGRSVRDQGLGVFDLTVLRYGSTPFRLSLVRADHNLEVRVEPREWQR